MKKSLIAMTSLVVLSLVTGCMTTELNKPLEDTSSIDRYNKKESKYVVTGRAEFPTNSLQSLPYHALQTPFSKGEIRDGVNSFHSLGKRGAGGEFAVKANITEVGTYATVSIIYPPNGTKPNQTIATGLTGSDGKFTINPDSNFNPLLNEIFVLEAIKRIGNVGNAVMTIRTYIKWTGSGWNSMTTPDLLINTKTTALAVIDGYDNTISPADTIGTIDVSGATSVPSDVGSVTSATILNVSDLVVQVLLSNYDPMQYIKLVNDKYEIVNPPVIKNMIHIQGGTFTMGDQYGDGSTQERPTHYVTLSNFYAGKYEVTQGEYKSLVGSNPASGNGVGTNFPVYYVSWFDAIIYCNLKSQAEGLAVAYKYTGDMKTGTYTGELVNSSGAVTTDITQVVGYRLPTEAEWEYAAKGGNQTSYCGTSRCKYSGTTNALDSYVWYGGNNIPSGAKEVGTKLPNELGMYDMSGNVWEWTQDWSLRVYTTDPVTNPWKSTAPFGSSRVIRGGDWDYSYDDLRVAYRNETSPSISYDRVGFRLFRSAN